MADTEHFHPLRAFFRMLKGLFVLACAVIATFAVIAYASGWIEVRHERKPDKATIEIETGKVKQAAQNAITKGKNLVQETGDKIGKTEKGQTSDRPAEK